MPAEIAQQTAGGRHRFSIEEANGVRTSGCGKGCSNFWVRQRVFELLGAAKGVRTSGCGVLVRVQFEVRSSKFIVRRSRLERSNQEPPNDVPSNPELNTNPEPGSRKFELLVLTSFWRRRGASCRSASGSSWRAVPRPSPVA